MKQMKHTISQRNAANKALTNQELRQLSTEQKLTIGIDLGDQSSRYCILNAAGEIVNENKMPTSRAGCDAQFSQLAPARIAIEVGTHSPWVSHHLQKLGLVRAFASDYRA